MTERPLTFEEHSRLVNDWYLEQCRSQERYDALPGELKSLTVRFPIALPHLARRGHYDEYPGRQVCWAKDNHDLPVFVQCADCWRRSCTDAWLPYGYSAFFDRMRVAGDGSARSPYLFYCKQGCNRLKTEDRVALTQSTNYRCTYVKRY